MKYDELWNPIPVRRGTVDLDAQRMDWANRRTVHTTIRAVAENHLTLMENENEALRRFNMASPHEREKMIKQIVGEETARRSLGAGVALRQLKLTAADLQRRVEHFTQARRHDVGLSFPDALVNVDANGMLMFQLLKETLRPMIESASPDALLRIYQHAWESKSARGQAECELIEERVEHGRLVAKTEDLAAAKELRDMIDGVQDLRVEPAEELRRIEETLAKATKAIVRAEVLQVQPIDIEHPANTSAKAAFGAESDEFRTERALAEAARQGQ